MSLASDRQGGGADPPLEWLHTDRGADLKAARELAADGLYYLLCERITKTI